MKMKNLGTSNLKVSEIALGCMSLPNNLNEAQSIIDEALNVGITYFDTADLYGKGQNEEVVGQALGSRRQEIILATKVGNQWNRHSDQVTWNPSPDYIKSQVHESLRRLKTDYIDLYQLHGGMITDPSEETIEAFETLKKEGLIREYGISSIRPNVIKRFMEQSAIVSIMMQYSLLDRRPEEFLDEIGASGISVVTRGTLAKGLLTSEALDRAKDKNGYMDYSQEELEKVLNELLSIEPNLNALALHAALQHGTVASIVAGASSPAQIRDTIAAYETSISADQINMAKKYTTKAKYKEHRE
ncbi:aldo/keto reductase [Planococcus halotolerans]|uniref:Aldo/keto reductase n=1 Tax=Planococcus halotolerans TaxID=2233542 RepID=A0A365L253_9BACL|nr:aldo/keto reductase [Planococcus halotolerans]QHJ71090.1 aldo/keto reductase [Planococcus halotolerans]RAZ79149.1 aldo/keto reductase [Planococcus halotolerans]